MALCVSSENGIRRKESDEEPVTHARAESCHDWPSPRVKIAGPAKKT
jgi:hypothetical protein